MVFRRLWVLASVILYLVPSLYSQLQASRLPRVVERSGPTGLVLAEGWSLASSYKVDQPGEVISTPRFQPTGWYTVTVPTTVVGALVKNKVYPDPYYGMNLRGLPGMNYPIGKNFSNIPMQQDNPFMVPWWYRKAFLLPESYRGRMIWLDFDGINYRADVFLNGRLIKTHDEVAGAWRRYEFNISDWALPGKVNVLALKVFSPTDRSLAITFVDWNPAPPDKDMGLFRQVEIRTSGPVAVRYPAVVSKLEPEGSAQLTLTAQVKNGSRQSVSGVLRARFEDREISQNVELAPGEQKDVHFDAAAYPELKLDHPRLWWPAQMGKPELYNLKMDFETGGRISDRTETRFGVREITSELNANGKRLFAVNGKRILIRGGGWSPDMMLRDNPLRLRQEFAYVEDMGLNTIRLEGKLESEDFFNLADERGILVMAGWCCCDHWERWANWTDEDHQIAELSLRDQMYRLRSHPSLLVWLNGSDNPPPADVEQTYLKVEKELLWPNPVVSSATARETPVSGGTGVKMSGPYEYVAPSYWMEDSTAAGHPACKQGECGGGYGFNTETSPGPAVPPLESIEAMLPREHWWPIDDWWNYHAGGGEFKDLHVFTEALNARYGPATTLEDYTFKSQVQAYEGIRAMFEAYSRNKYTATGVIQWMLNNAWPSMIWHLYDYFLRPGGGYFGAKTALQALDPVYGYDDRSVYLVNSRYQEAQSLRVITKVLNLDMAEKFSQETPVEVPPDGVVKVLSLPEIAELSPTYFLALRVVDRNQQVVGSNFYWLLTKAETIEWAHSDWYMTPTLAYADFTALAELPKIKLNATAHSERVGENQVTRVRLANPTKSLAFFVRLKLDRGKAGGEILPVIWQGNYVSLLPGEERDITATYRASQLGNEQPYLEVKGWNAD